MLAFWIGVIHLFLPLTVIPQASAGTTEFQILFQQFILEVKQLLPRKPKRFNGQTAKVKGLKMGYVKAKMTVVKAVTCSIGGISRIPSFFLNRHFFSVSWSKSLTQNCSGCFRIPIQPYLLRLKSYISI